MNKIYTFLLLFLCNISIYAQELEHTLTGHEDLVFSLQFSPNGKLLVSGSCDGTINLWNAKNGSFLKSASCASKLLSVCFSPDCKNIAVGLDDFTIQIRELPTLTKIKTFSGHQSFVCFVTYSPDGKIIASASFDNSIRLWDVKSGNVISNFSGHSAKLRSISFSPDGKYLASASDDKTVRVWEVATGNEVISLPTSNRAMSVNFSGDGRFLICGDFDKNITIWQIINGQFITYKTLRTRSNSWSVQFNSDGSAFAVGGEASGGKSQLGIWNTQTGEEVYSLSDDNCAIYSVAFSPNGKQLAAAYHSGNIRIYNTGKMAPKMSAQLYNYVNTRMNLWQECGPFEKSSDFQSRVNKNSRNAMYTQLTKEAISVFGEDVLRDATLKNDIENETVKISFKNFAPIYLQVPNTEGQSFKDNFSRMEYNSLEYGAKDSLLIITKAVLINPENRKRYSYDCSRSYNFKGERISINMNMNMSDIQISNSDVDLFIPDNKLEMPNRYAVIIGNEDYNKSGNLDAASNVPYARNDASVFKQYCEKTLGVRTDHIKYIEDASLGQMKGALTWISQLIRAKEGAAEVFFYFAGHGLPDEATKVPYLFPVDAVSGDYTTAIKLTDVYEALTKFPAEKVVVFLDACFSGGGRDQGLILGRSGRMKAKQETVAGNMVVFSASAGDQIAMQYKDKQHGLFTYFLLRKLQLTQGDVTLADLANFINEQVKEQSVIINNKSQTPEVNVSVDAQNNWEGWKMK